MTMPPHESDSQGLGVRFVLLVMACVVWWVSVETMGELLGLSRHDAIGVAVFLGPAGGGFLGFAIGTRL